MENAASLNDVIAQYDVSTERWIFCTIQISGAGIDLRWYVRLIRLEGGGIEWDEKWNFN